MNNHCPTATPIEVISVLAVTALVAVVVFLALVAASPSSALLGPARANLARAALFAVVWTASVTSTAAVTALVVIG